MKKVTTDLETYLNTEKSFTSCDLYEMTLSNGNKYYYADTDQDIVYNGRTYQHNALLIKRSQIDLQSDVSVDTLTVTICADPDDKIENKPLLRAAHEGVLDGAVLALRRCFFRGALVLGAIGLFAGNVEVKHAGGVDLQLSVKSKTQGLNMKFPILKYYPQKAYITSGEGVISSTDIDNASVVAPYVPLKEILI